MADKSKEDLKEQPTSNLYDFKGELHSDVNKNTQKDEEELETELIDKEKKLKISINKYNLAT